MNPFILIVTNSNERNVERVIAHLDTMGQKYHRINTDLLHGDSSLTTSVQGNIVEHYILVRGERITCSEAKSIWWRRPEPLGQPDDTPEPQRLFVEQESKAALWSLATTLTGFWLNHPLHAVRLLEHNKVYQLRVAASAGLDTPETIVTNNPADLIEFCRNHGSKVALKTIGGHAFQKRDSGEFFGIYTNLVSLDQIMERTEEVKLAPVMAQAYVPKQLEFRITVVGQKIFACAIHSQDSPRTMHDWRRYDFKNVRHEAYQLPREIESKLLRLMETLHLQFGAIDMILTPDGRYVFLEVNPSGQWLWIEHFAKLPISQAIADLLAHPPTS